MTQAFSIFLQSHLDRNSANVLNGTREPRPIDRDCLHKVYLLNTARNYVDQAPWMAGLSIFLLVLSFNRLGDGLRDALDPRHK